MREFWTELIKTNLFAFLRPKSLECAETCLARELVGAEGHGYSRSATLLLLHHLLQVVDDLRRRARLLQKGHTSQAYENNGLPKHRDRTTVYNVSKRSASALHRSHRVLERSWCARCRVQNILRSQRSSLPKIPKQKNIPGSTKFFK